MQCKNKCFYWNGLLSIHVNHNFVSNGDPSKLSSPCGLSLKKERTLFTPNINMHYKESNKYLTKK